VALAYGCAVTDYLQINRAYWDERAPAHAASPDYGLQRFVDDSGHLSDIVQFDLPLLGDIDGVRGIHLQCHIGTDTLSLARLGADMTGLDFSPSSLAEARALAERAGPAVRYLQADLYDAVQVAGAASYDLVFTGIGALCWLPDVRRWAQVVAGLLRPGGRLFIREGHPMMWAMADPRPDGLLVVDFPYFERDEPTVWEEGGTYVQTDAEFVVNTTHDFHHGLGQIIDALLCAGLELTGITEHESVPWNALPGMMEQLPNGEYRLADRPWRLPCTYTLQARLGSR